MCIDAYNLRCLSINNYRLLWFCIDTYRWLLFAWFLFKRLKCFKNSTKTGVAVME